MDRIEIINSLIKKNNYKTYLEIGVRNPDDCFNRIVCNKKHSVDPGVEGDFGFDFNMTSNDFFKINNNNYDIIFIDGLHIDEQVEEDIINSLKCLSPNGSIVIHDCNPPTVYHAREDYMDRFTPAGGFWNGTVWKAVVKIREDLKDIHTSVVDTDWGVGIIQKSSNPNPIVNENKYFSYDKFSQNRNYYLNLISPGEFIKKYINPETTNLTWLARFNDFSSMGILSQKIIENIKTANVSCKEIIGETKTDNQLIYQLIKNPVKKDLGIMFAYPDMVGELESYKTKVIYTGLDSTLGIPNFSNNCNKSDFILTPSQISKNRMVELGVKKPIYVFPHGVDPDKFKFSKKNTSGVFKFLYIGELSDRKGSFHLLDAFIKVFGGSTEVELHIKSNTEMLFYGGTELENIINQHPNIKWNKSDDNNVEDLYSDCHAYVYPSRADSFGMTIIEAMACGLPVISTCDPGSTELIQGRFFEVKSSLVEVKDHPWMLGQWGEPDQEDLENKMLEVYSDYKKIIDSGNLEENSRWVRENLNWSTLVEKFEKDIIPKLFTKRRILTLCTSFNRPHHISNVIDSLKSIRETHIQNDVYLVENSNPDIKPLVIETIKSKTDTGFTLYDSNFNLGQRGALLQMLEDRNLDDYDFIQFTDQDNEFLEPLSTYCNVLDDFEDCFFVTGYMSKEHGEIGWRESDYGNLCEKRSLRAGHMFMRAKDLKSLLPIYLDSQYNQPQNSSWNAGLDWELSWWNPNAPAKRNENPFVLCVPGGVLHKGIDSTMYEWDVNSYEYKIEELKNLRNPVKESDGNKEYILNEEPIGV